MVDANVFAMKLKELSRRLAKVRAHCPVDPEAFSADSDALDLVSFNLLLAIQTCVDLATHVIADEGWAPAATAGEAFEPLEARGILSKETAQSLRKAVGLRNLVAHGYAGVDPAKIHAAARTGLPDLERFATELSTWVEGQIGAAG